MGVISEGILNGDFDCLTGEWLGEGSGFPRTTDREHAKSTSVQLVQHKDGRVATIDHDPENYAKGTKAIRKELAILINRTKKANPEKNENVIINECRQAINTKYGKGWREQF